MFLICNRLFVLKLESFIYLYWCDAQNYVKCCLVCTPALFSLYLSSLARPQFRGYVDMAWKNCMYNALLIKRNGLHFSGIELSDRVLNTTVSFHIFKTTRNTYVECAKFIPRPIAIHTRISIIDRIKRTSICISYMDDKIQSSAKSPT